MNVQEEIKKNAVPLPLSPTRMLVKRRLQSSCSTLGGEIREAGTVKGRKQETLLSLTGWISKNNVGFR